MSIIFTLLFNIIYIAPEKIPLGYRSEAFKIITTYVSKMHLFIDILCWEDKLFEF